MKFTLPALPYAPNALEPAISQQTIEYHYGKHLPAYINNLNKLIEGTEWENAELAEIVRTSEGAVFNNAAQVWNHTFYFESFSPEGGGEPVGALRSAILTRWGSFGAFKEEMNKAALGLFGSGWVWLVSDRKGHVSIMSESNAGNPLTKGYIPLLTFDVWEHAYYIDYRNQRADHLMHIWGIIDWKLIEQRYLNRLNK
ncbi:MAG: superoxide dismutase [Paludibacteraceae bacterium]|nr:superoxide dismutase [Paludibacteraceae bacterium]